MRKDCLILVALSLAGIAGCSQTTETGYAYRPLRDSSTAQRAYYAAPFSPEARAAQQEGGGAAGLRPGPRGR